MPKSTASNASARVDQDLVASAYRKVMNKEDLTKQERVALKRHEREKEERLRWQYYASIPQKHWREMSGRQTKVINEQATRHGIPFGGATINLRAVVRAFHDFLADNAVKLAREDDALMQGNARFGGKILVMKLNTCSSVAKTIGSTRSTITCSFVQSTGQHL